MIRKKCSLSTLIANDIVHYGMDMTENFNYIVYLDDYAKEFDKDSKDYIYNHKSEIIEEIEHNENIADFVYDEKNNSFDMVFYFDGLLDRVEKMIYNACEVMNKELEIEDIREISESIYDEEDFTDNIITKVARYEGKYENEI